MRYRVAICVQGQRVWEEVCEVTGRCLCLSAAAEEWCARIQRLFFLNEGFDLSRQSPAPSLTPFQFEDIVPD